MERKENFYFKPAPDKSEPPRVKDEPEMTAVEQEQERLKLNEAEWQIFAAAEKMKEKRPPVSPEHQAKLAEYRSRKADQVPTRRGVILEYIFRQNIELNDWAGDNCFTAETSDWDDVRNHADFVIEWVEEKNGQKVVTRLVVDMTTSQKPEKFEKKERLIKEDLAAGRMAKLDEFVSAVAEPGQEKIGYIDHLPRVVVAMGIENTQRLAGDAVHRKKEMGKNPAQLIFLEQIRDQMYDQMEYCLDLIFKQLNHGFASYHSINDEAYNREIDGQLAEILDAVKELRYSPYQLPELIERIQQTTLLFPGLNKNPQVMEYWGNLETLNNVLRIVSDILMAKTKSGLFSDQVLMQFSQRRQKNIVLRAVNENLNRFKPPAELEKRLGRVA